MLSYIPYQAAVEIGSTEDTGGVVYVQADHDIKNDALVSTYQRQVTHQGRQVDATYVY